MEAPAVWFRDTTPPPIEAELRRRCGCYIHVVRYREEKEISLKACNNVT